MERHRTLSTPRFSHIAVLLVNGKVLVAGGYGDASFTSLITTEIYDPDTAWSAAGDLSVARANHVATLLAGGRVLVTGRFAGAAQQRRVVRPGSGTMTAQSPTTRERSNSIRVPLMTTATGPPRDKSKADWEGALADYARSIEIKPDALTYSNRGLVWRVIGEFERALADYRRAIELDPHWANAYAQRGLTYLLQGRDVEVQRDFAQSLTLDQALKPSLERLIREARHRTASK